WAEGRYDQLPVLASDLVDRRVAAIAAVATAYRLFASSICSRRRAITFGRTGRGCERSFSVHRRGPFGPALRERVRDGGGRPQTTCRQLWVPRRFGASSCVPTWSRPHCSRLSFLGSGANSRPCQVAACVGARLSWSRPIRIRSQPRQLQASRLTGRPLGRP